MSVNAFASRPPVAVSATASRLSWARRRSAQTFARESSPNVTKSSPSSVGALGCDRRDLGGPELAARRAQPAVDVARMGAERDAQAGGVAVKDRLQLRLQHAIRRSRPSEAGRRPCSRARGRASRAWEAPVR